MEIAQAKLLIEAALLSSIHPLSVGELRKLFDLECSAEQIESILASLVDEWQGRGVRLVPVASGWRFQTAPELASQLARLNPDKPARYSRAVLETLAIVAYRQPVTRGDIEDIRGVTVSTQVVRTLEERGWIEVIGHKDVIGRPALFATTRQFLDDLGLRSLDELPALATGRDAEGDIPLIGQQSLALSLDASVAGELANAAPFEPASGRAADAIPTDVADALPPPAVALTDETGAAPELLVQHPQTESPQPMQSSAVDPPPIDSPAPLKGIDLEH